MILRPPPSTSHGDNLAGVAFAVIMAAIVLAIILCLKGA